MEREIAIVGAPTALGIKPYADGGVRRLDLAPGEYRRLGLVERLGARDDGDLPAPPYEDFERTRGQVRNEWLVADYSRQLAERVRAAGAHGEFVLVLGGDCSIVLGNLLGVSGRQASASGARRVGLAYVDAHADYASHHESATGSASSMCLADVTGRNDTVLARVGGGPPLVAEEDVVLVGRNPHADEPEEGRQAVARSRILDLTRDTIRRRGAADASHVVLERLTRPGVDGFWIHVDADVVDPSYVPAVDSPEPGGLTPDELVGLLAPLVRHPGALGMEVTIFDPALGGGGEVLVDVLGRLLAWRLA
jgi:arginase